MILIGLPHRIHTSQHKRIYSKKKTTPSTPPFPSLTSQPQLFKLAESKERHGAE